MALAISTILLIIGAIIVMWVLTTFLSKIICALSPLIAIGLIAYGAWWLYKRFKLK